MTFVLTTYRDRVNNASAFIYLNHSAEKLINLLFAIAEVTTLDVVGSLLAPATGGGVQLEANRVSVKC